MVFVVMNTSQYVVSVVMNTSQFVVNTSQFVAFVVTNTSVCGVFGLITVPVILCSHSYGLWTDL